MAWNPGRQQAGGMQQVEHSLLILLPSFTRFLLVTVVQHPGPPARLDVLSVPEARNGGQVVSGGRNQRLDGVLGLPLEAAVFLALEVQQPVAQNPELPQRIADEILHCSEIFPYHDDPVENALERENADQVLVALLYVRA